MVLANTGSRAGAKGRIEAGVELADGEVITSLTSVEVGGPTFTLRYKADSTFKRGTYSSSPHRTAEYSDCPSLNPLASPPSRSSLSKSLRAKSSSQAHRLHTCSPLPMPQKTVSEV